MGRWKLKDLMSGLHVSQHSPLSDDKLFFVPPTGLCGDYPVDRVSLDLTELGGTCSCPSNWGEHNVCSAAAAVVVVPSGWGVSHQFRLCTDCQSWKLKTHFEYDLLTSGIFLTCLSLYTWFKQKSRVCDFMIQYKYSIKYNLSIFDFI